MSPGLGHPLSVLTRCIWKLNQECFVLTGLGGHKELGETTQAAPGLEKLLFKVDHARLGQVPDHLQGLVLRRKSVLRLAVRRTCGGVASRTDQ